MRILGIDYGDSRTGFAITDALNITVQGLETLASNGNDKMILKKIDEYLLEYEIDTIVIGMPFGLDGAKTPRTEKTEKFMHKLKCKYNKLKIDYMDERLTTVAAHKTMNFLDIDKHKKRNIVDTISAIYILETYVNRLKNSQD
jgi:putative Holliday junction resolvase